MESKETGSQSGAEHKEIILEEKVAKLAATSREKAASEFIARRGGAEKVQEEFWYNDGNPLMYLRENPPLSSDLEPFMDINGGRDRYKSGLRSPGTR